MCNRSILILLLSFLFLSQLQSQVSQDDVVYLKNGTFLRGKIIEIVPGKSLKITFREKDTLEIQMIDIKLIRKEDSPKETLKNFKEGVKSEGYTFIGELNYGLGLLEGLDRYKDTPQEQYSLMLSIFNGFTITPFIQLGIGVAADVWKTRIFFPMYLDLRANIFKQDNSPFLYVNTGYSAGWIQGEAGVDLGGATAGIGAGAKFRVRGKQLMDISLGYRFQQTRQFQINNRVKVKATRDAHFVIIRMGFIL